jgi:hypothetical protein
VRAVEMNPVFRRTAREREAGWACPRAAPGFHLRRAVRSGWWRGKRRDKQRWCEAARGLVRRGCAASWWRTAMPWPIRVGLGNATLIPSTARCGACVEVIRPTVRTEKNLAVSRMQSPSSAAYMG